MKNSETLKNAATAGSAFSHRFWSRSRGRYGCGMCGCYGRAQTCRYNYPSLYQTKRPHRSVSGYRHASRRNPYSRQYLCHYLGNRPYACENPHNSARGSPRSITSNRRWPSPSGKRRCYSSPLLSLCAHICNGPPYSRCLLASRASHRLTCR